MPRGGQRSYTHQAGLDTDKSRAPAREAADETMGGGGGGRGGRARGTASRTTRARTTSESTGEIDGDPLPSRRKPTSGGRGRGAKTDAPRAKGTASGRGSSGKKKSVNRPGRSGSPKKRR